MGELIYWVAIGLGVLASFVSVGWARERQESKEWQIVCVCLGNEYDKLMAELNQAPKTSAEHDQRVHWLN